MRDHPIQMTDFQLMTLASRWPSLDVLYLACKPVKLTDVSTLTGRFEFSSPLRGPVQGFIFPEILYILPILRLHEILPPTYAECVSQKIKGLIWVIVQTFKPDNTELPPLCNILTIVIGLNRMARKV